VHDRMNFRQRSASHDKSVLDTGSQIDPMMTGAALLSFAGTMRAVVAARSATAIVSVAVLVAVPIGIGS
jgi:hypothetical protein